MFYADTPTTDTEVYIDAPPSRVWGLVTDIQLIASISTELTSVRWDGDVDGPALGAKFIGSNFHKAFGAWETTSIVIDLEQPRVFAWAVTDVEFPSAVWRFTLRPERSGTVLNQWVQMGPARSGLSHAIDRMPDKEERIVARRLDEFRAGMTTNLATIKELSERPEG
jgi:uncharacterized protein YndB with AHSA1/START domain